MSWNEMKSIRKILKTCVMIWDTNGNNPVLIFQVSQTTNI